MDRSSIVISICIFFLLHMPLTKKVKSARKRLQRRIRNVNTGRLEKALNASESDFDNSEHSDVFFSENESYSSDSDDNFEDNLQQTINNLGKLELVWLKKQKKKIRNRLIISKATKFRKYGPSGTYTKAAKGTKSITQYFPITKNEESTDSENKDKMETSDTNSDIDAISLDENTDDNVNVNDMINNLDTDDDFYFNEDDNNDYNVKNNIEELKKLECILSNKKKQTAHDYLQYWAIHKYFVYLEKYKLGKIQASERAAEEVYDKGSYQARIIRKWAKFWLENRTLYKSMQGCHQKTKSFIDDEDIINKSLIFIRQNNGKITPKDYQNYVNLILFSDMGIVNKKITVKTSRVWLKKIGLVPQPRKKGIYFDGHERKDVLEYRAKFLEELKELEQFMPMFVGDDMIQINPEIPNNQQLHIFVTHDECLFYANDDRPIVWTPIGEPPLRKKGQGKSIMISEFLLETIGCLKLTSEQSLLNPNIPIEARKYLKPGKNEEGWWTADHLIDQVINYAIPIFETIYPGAIAVMAFDNSTNHGAMPEDGLNVTKMNVNPGGKQPLMHSTYFGPNNTPQSMVFPPDHSQYPNKAKGMKQILIERSLWKDGLNGDCKLCKGKKKVVDPQRVDCCMRRILSLQPDFIAQKSRLQIEIEKRGHKCIFYPKYHCELNYIEMYWGAAKRYARENCDYTWAGLQKIVPKALDSVPLITIRRYAQKSWRYMDIYRKGITGKIAEFAVKKYKSHRRVPDSIYKELDLIKF